MNIFPRILYITDISGLGGGETSLLNILIMLQKNGFNPVLACPKGELLNRAAQSGIKTIEIQFPIIRMYFGFIPSFSLIAIGKFVKLIKKNKIDVVHVESQKAFYYFGMAAWLAKVPCVVTYHGYWRLKSPFSRWFLKNFCDRFYPVSKNTYFDIQQEYILPTEKIKLIPLGVNEQFFSELPEKSILRKDVGLPNNKKIIMQVARFQAIKGQMNLLEAYVLLIAKKKDNLPLLIFVGDILDKNSLEAMNYKNKVQERATQADLINHVYFLGEREDIPNLIKAADIMVIPSDFETFSMATIEAMAVGTPLIATSSGGPSEIIYDHETGILVPPKNPSALAEAIYLLLSDPKLASELASNAKGIAKITYNPKIRSEILGQEYFQLISPGNK